METRDIVFISLFAAITAGLAVFPPITLPVVGVPITVQNIGPMLAGGVLGAKRGSLSTVLFLLLVAIGLPLLPAGRGGFGVFLGPTGGYLIGWIFTAFVVGCLIEVFWHQLNYLNAFLALVLGGIVVLYAIGIPWSAFVAQISIWTAFVGSLLFFVGDFIKCLLVAVVIVIVKKSYPIITPRKGQNAAIR